jgi:hypothetical protein
MHVPAEQNEPLPHAWVLPQPPQLAESVMKFTQAPLQSVYDVSHATPQPVPLQVACACAMLTGQTLPQVMQLLGSVVVSTQRPLHCVGVVLGQLPTHA